MKTARAPLGVAPLADRGKLLALGLGNLLATIDAGRRHVVTQVHFTGGRLDSQRGGNQEIVGTMHTALGRGLFVLLNSHETLLEEYLNLAAQLAQNGEGRNFFIAVGFHRRFAIFVAWHQGQGEENLIFHQGQQVGLRLHLEGIDLIVLQLILRQLFTGTKQQETIPNTTGPHQSLKTALTLQHQVTLDPQIDVELALVVTLAMKLERHRTDRLQQRIGQTTKTLYRHRSLHATSISGQRPQVDHEAFLRHKRGMILFSAPRVKTLLDRANHRDNRLSATMKLVLASTSAYRRELLQRFDLPFDVARPDIDETPLPGEAPQATAERLAVEKARAVAGQFPDTLIIGSDQVAYMGDARFGKPGTIERAITQLKSMSGRTVIFHTALALLNTRSGHVQVDAVPTEVRFRNLSDDEIVRYVNKERPLDCAGSAKSEGLGITLLDALSGDDPNALVGLPLIALARMLRNEGIALP